MRHAFHSGGVLAAGLLVACATGSREVRDEGLVRIEEAMRPEVHPEVIPEGIALGDDAPPLAPWEPEVTAPSRVVSSDGGPPEPGWFYGAVPLIVPGPVYGPHPGSVRYRIDATPGGTTPGLLP